MIGSFKRNQLTWAIWHTIDRGRMTTQEPPKKVLHLIRRLIDLDRQIGIDARSRDVWRTKHAFIDGPTAGLGGENAYTVVDAVALWIGIELLDAGLPQKEVTQFLRQLRNQLQRAVLKLLATHLDLVEQTASRRTGSEATKLMKGESLAPDELLYLVTESVTPDGVLAAERKGVGSNLCQGRDALLRFMAEASTTARRFMVVEIGNATLSLAYFLLISEPSKRGRPASE